MRHTMTVLTAAALLFGALGYGIAAQQKSSSTAAGAKPTVVSVFKSPT